MSKRSVRTVAAALAAALFVIPMSAYAESAPAAKKLQTKLETEAAFAALQVGKQVHVFNENGQLFQTNSTTRSGDLKDLFTIPYGPEVVPMVLVANEKYGYMVFSDLWPKIVPGQEKNTSEAYYSGRVTLKPQSKIVSRTKHHYAEKKGDEVIVYTANNFDDLSEGYHESMRVKGELRGLVLYDCCPYVVVDDGGEALSVYHAGEKGPEKGGEIELG